MSSSPLSFAISPPYRVAALVVALTGALTGCGGGSDSGAASDDAKRRQKIEVAFTAPETQNNVFNVGTSSVPLSVQIKVSNKPIANGNAVAFTTTAGSLAAASVATVNGQASTTLTPPAQTGPATVQASVNVSGQVSSATQTLYMRPVPQALEVLVPAYFGAGLDSPIWDALIDSARSYPDVKITAILNPPDSGIFTAVNFDLTTAATNFKATGKTDANGVWNRKVIGYVSTDYGQEGRRSLSDVKANVDNYRAIYPVIDGIFLDEMSNEAQRVPFYTDVYNYIKGLDSKFYIVGNPGTYPNEAYAALADTLVTFEGKESAYQSINPQPANAWVYHKTNTTQAMLVHDASTCSAMQSAVTQAHLARNNTGVVYVTDLPYDFATNTGNPWARLPIYWKTLLGTVDAINKNRALPVCNS